MKRLKPGQIFPKHNSIGNGIYNMSKTYINKSIQKWENATAPSTFKSYQILNPLCEYMTEISQKYVQMIAKSKKKRNSRINCRKSIE